MNLISLLEYIQNHNLTQIQEFLSKHKGILENLETLGVLTVTSSDNPLKISLTPLGESILSSNQILSILKLHDTVLHSITSDLQRIKTSLSAISLDVIRNQTIEPNSSVINNSLLKKDTESFSDSKEVSKERLEPSITTSNVEQVKSYILELKQTLPENEINHHRYNLNTINKNYKKIIQLMQQKEFHEFGLESYLLMDAMFIFILNLFDTKNPSVLNLPLEKKYRVLKNFPLQIELELVQFLDQFFTDNQSNTEDALKIGEKTAEKIFKVLTNVYESFSNLFE